MSLRRGLLAAFVVLLAALPLLPVPEFWITQANYIGLYSLVTIGLVTVLVSVVALTIVAYTMPRETVAYGMAAALLVAGAGGGLVVSPNQTLFYQFIIYDTRGGAYGAGEYRQWCPGFTGSTYCVDTSVAHFGMPIPAVGGARYAYNFDVAVLSCTTADGTAYELLEGDFFDDQDMLIVVRTPGAFAF